MPTDKGHCKHGEFILTEGCPQCMAERQAESMGKATIGRLTLWEEPDGATVGELQLNNEQPPVPDKVTGMINNAPRTPYRLADGTIVPGVTTVLSVLDKGEGMQYWAWDLGRQGLDYREVRDSAARVGTLAHYLIACHLEGSTPLPGGYSPQEVEKANKCFVKYLAWEMKNAISPVMIETPLVSEEFKYGGTLDLLAEIGGEFALIDFKTGDGFYDSYLHQVAAYRKLLEEQGWPVARAWILRISPDDGEYEVAMQIDFDRDWQIFQHALAIWRLQNSGVV